MIARLQHKECRPDREWKASQGRRPGHLFLWSNGQVHHPQWQLRSKEHVAAGTLTTAPVAEAPLTLPILLCCFVLYRFGVNSLVNRGAKKRGGHKTSSRSSPRSARFLIFCRANSATGQRLPPLPLVVPPETTLWPRFAPAASTSTGALKGGIRPSWDFAAGKEDIDGLPRRVTMSSQNQGDMVNFVLVGSEQQSRNALDAASWRIC